jgi:hypothetical protein
MGRRRQLALGLGVTALLALVAVAAGGRPLSGTRATGPSARFFDYVYTTTIIGVVVVLVVAAYVLALQRFAPVHPRPRRHLLSTVLGLVFAAAVATFFLHGAAGKRLQNLFALVGRPPAKASTHAAASAKNVRNARVRWDEVAVVLVLAGGVAVLLLASRSTKRAPRPWGFGSRDAVSLAFDESLDDLRRDPDLRRAIIAAYARMERALAAGGVPRRPSEAPVEYLERALLGLDTSAEAVRRLTVLFEWAKFSQHVPDPTMRDEAIDALEAVRSELRRPAAAVA